MNIMQTAMEQNQIVTVGVKVKYIYHESCIHYRSMQVQTDKENGIVRFSHFKHGIVFCCDKNSK